MPCVSEAAKARQRAYQRAYKQTPEAKARQRARSQTPEAKAYERARSRTPERKAAKRAAERASYRNSRAALTFFRTLAIAGAVGQAVNRPAD